MSNQDRRYAAIMFTDIVGYTSLMGSDEDKAFEVLEKNSEIHNRLISQFNGALIKAIGDGMLVSFNLASDAVRCAIELQKVSKEQGIPLKIGIHQGEVVFAEADVLGDGVNIASRLQDNADAGSINISGRVNSDVKNIQSINTRFIEEKTFKNVDEPIKVYQVLIDGEEKNSASKKPSKIRKRFPTYMVGGLVVILVALLLIKYLLKNDSEPAIELEKSIAVLPFKNISPNVENQYILDGIMEAVLNYLTQIKDLRVISSTSVGQYRETTKTIPQIGKELNVNYILEGSGQKYGDNFRLTVQLIDAKEDIHIWSSPYDRKIVDILEVQSEIAIEITSELKTKISEEEEIILNMYTTNNQEAYVKYLKAQQVWKIDRMRAIQYLEEAIAIDPQFVDAYTRLCGFQRTRAFHNGDLSSSEALILAMPPLEMAFEIDPDNIGAHRQLGNIKYLLEWDFEGAEKEFEKVREVLGYPLAERVPLLIQTRRYENALQTALGFRSHDPMQSYYVIALSYLFLNEFEKAFETWNEQTDLGMGTSHAWIGRAHMMLENFEKAKYHLEKRLPDRSPFFLSDLAICYYKLGQIEKATEIINELIEKYEKGEQGSIAFMLGKFHAGIGEIETAFDWLEKSYQDHELEMIWLYAEPQFKSLESDERYQDLLKRVGFK